MLITSYVELLSEISAGYYTSSQIGTDLLGIASGYPLV